MVLSCASRPAYSFSSLSADSGFRVGSLQVTSREDMSQALGGLRCKINPGPRTHAASAYFKQQLVLVGGRSGEDELKNDAWYRDDRTPTAYIASGPSSYTSGRCVRKQRGGRVQSSPREGPCGGSFALP